MGSIADSDKVQIYLKGWIARETQCPVQKAFSYLESSLSICSGFQIKISRNQDLSNCLLLPRWEKFTSALAVDLLKDMPIDSAVVPFLLKFVEPEWKNKEWPQDYEAFNYFTNRDICQFPDDVDDTSLCTLALYDHGKMRRDVFNRIVERVLSNTVKESGVIQTYLPPQGSEGRMNRVCCAVCCNAMRLIYAAGMRTRAPKTEEYLLRTLETRAYINHIEFYSVPDIFLYFLSMAVVRSKEARDLFLDKLTSNLLDRAKDSEKQSILASAYRILAAEALGLLNIPSFASNLESDVRRIRETQLSDGSWPNDEMMHTNRMRLYYGSEVVTTLHAARALKVTEFMLV